LVATQVHVAHGVAEGASIAVRVTAVSELCPQPFALSGVGQVGQSDELGGPVLHGRSAHQQNPAGPPGEDTDDLRLPRLRVFHELCLIHDQESD
jgi:hypothetical protein